MALTAQQRAELERIKRKYGYTSSQQAPTEQKPKKTLLQKASDISEKFLKTGADFTINTPARALLRPFVETTKAVQRLLPGGKTGRETVKTPFGDITPRILGEKQGVLQSGGEVLDLALTALPIQKVAGKIASPLFKRAEKLYQSVLKPSEKLAKAGVVKTGLEEGIVVSKKGLSKVQGIMDDIGEEIGRVIDTGIAEGKTITKKNLIPYLDEMKEYLGNSLGGKNLVKEVDNISKNILSGLSKDIPIKQAQVIKQNTQRILSKYYGQFAPVEKEVKKQLTRGIKESIAEVVPEIKKLNARDAKLFGLEDAMENALKRLGNREIITLNDAVSFGTGLLGGGTASSGVAASIAFRILKNPSFTSGRAILYNQLAKNAETAIKLGRWPVVSVIGGIMNKLNTDSSPKLLQQ
jgi:hypothetical protein